MGLKGRVRRVVTEARTRLANATGRPRLYRLGTPERVGAVYHHPSDMCVADRLMLYALVRGLRPGRVLEVGVRWGGGARIIAAALEDVGGAGRAVGIDPLPGAFRPRPGDLFGRYELLCGYSPEAIPQAVAKLGGSIDFAFIDAMHTHDHVLADLRGVLPHLSAGGHVLLHDAFHLGIDRAVATVLADQPTLVDCGLLTRHADVTDAPVAYQGLRLLRAGPVASSDLIGAAYRQAGRDLPVVTPEVLNWDPYYQLLQKAGGPADRVTTT